MALNRVLVIEGGGITYHPQDGNPKPRMFRSDSDRALVNWMGFNNPGAVETREGYWRQGEWQLATATISAEQMQQDRNVETINQRRTT